MKKTSLTKRLTSLLVCLALIASYVPLVAAADPVAQSAVTETVVDPGTAHTFESMMGTDADGNRYAGRVWVDKSVYKNGDTALLNTRGEAGSSFQVTLADDEAFQVIFSALGSTMTSKETVTSGGPMDVVLVMDTSTSMDDEDEENVTRLERTITAANALLENLLTIHDVRIAIVTYNYDSETVLPLASYTNGVKLVVNNYYNNNQADAGVVYAYDNSNLQLGKDSGYTMGTNLQAGIDRGFNILANATNTEGRVPVSIVLTDGQANRANRASFYNITGSDSASGDNLYLSTLLNAAYNKVKVEENYGADHMVYSVGVDLGTNTTARLLMNPADPSYGFNSSNYAASNAYSDFQTWASGQTVTNGGGWGGWGSSEWTFDHNYPNLNGAITDAKIAANIHYVDSYYDVTNANLQDAFQQIYKELISSAFNPISSSTSSAGGTGVDDTPLIYVDYIGQYMEIKEIQAITLFGSSYGVVKNANGTYTVDAGTGSNPTTNESWNTAEDIIISVTEEGGVQKLEIRINQEILPIIMEKVESETVGEDTAATITELKQNPLRVYYTVGVASDILLPNGEVDVSKIQGYTPNADGTVSFYSNRFGAKNPADASGKVYYGDAHVGFQPSPENRYYYHQANQRIFSAVTKENGAPVQWEDGLYGVDYNTENYVLTDLDYNTYLQYNADMDDTQNPVDHQVYTYVKFWRPTALQTDAANTAEEVSYLVYTNWSLLRESVGFYDATTQSYLNNGAVTSAAEAAAYLQANPNAELYAVLGVGSLRTSRLHNMTVAKSNNLTDSAIDRYAPVYTHENASAHHGNDVVVWLGNNGRITLNIDTGIALTKAVTEAIGNPDDLYELTVTVPAGVVADPVVVDESGNTLASTYTGNVLTVNVKAGQTVYISGIPENTECAIGENVNGDYYIESKTATVRVPLLSDVLQNGAAQFAPATVTNAPNKYGNLFITKEITSDHNVPASVLDKKFDITVSVGSALIGKKFTVKNSAYIDPYEVTVDSAGKIPFLLKARQTVEILDLPAGTPVTVTEADPGSNFAVTYRTRNHSGETADADNQLVIPSTGSATAVVLNHYTPTETTVDLDVVVNKTFADASVASLLNGGSFFFEVYKHGVAAPIATGEIPYAAQEYGDKSVIIENVLNNETYTEEGTVSYSVVEKKGSVANVSYDRTIYTFDVVVTDNGGQLEAKVIGSNNAEITNTVGDSALDYVTQFTNTYDTAPISMDIHKDYLQHRRRQHRFRSRLQVPLHRGGCQW